MKNANPETTLSIEGAEQTFPTWFGTEIARGFGLMQMLNLPSAPKGNRFIESVALWAADTWWCLRKLDIAESVDEQIMQDAFRALRCSVPRWPTPSLLIDAIAVTLWARNKCLAGGAQ